MMKHTQHLVKAIYFQKIATQIARKSPESIRRRHSVVRIPEKKSYDLAARYVANFLYNHGMEMSLYLASIETAGGIQKKRLPTPVGHELHLSDSKNLYQQLKRAIRPVSLKDLKPSRGYIHEHHHRHHHHRREDLTPSVAYRETANMLTKRASFEIRRLGLDPNDPSCANKLYDEFRDFLAEKQRAKDAPPKPEPEPEPEPIDDVAPSAKYSSIRNSPKVSSSKSSTTKYTYETTSNYETTQTTETTEMPATIETTTTTETTTGATSSTVADDEEEDEEEEDDKEEEDNKEEEDDEEEEEEEEEEIIDDEEEEEEEDAGEGEE